MRQEINGYLGNVSYHCYNPGGILWGFTTTHYIENTLGCIEFFTRHEGNFYASADDKAEMGHGKNSESMHVARAENSFTVDINIIAK